MGLRDGDLEFRFKKHKNREEAEDEE